jgi:magnesium-transporting ATPase (P-type)
MKILLIHHITISLGVAYHLFNNPVIGPWQYIWYAIAWEFYVGMAIGRALWP